MPGPKATQVTGNDKQLSKVVNIKLKTKSFNTNFTLKDMKNVGKTMEKQWKLYKRRRRQKKNLS